MSYWCCGNERKDSKGCIISFHAIDSSESIENNELTEKKCLTCRSREHNYKECPKDPNYMMSLKGNISPKEELERIENVRKHKVKLKTRAFSIMEEKEESADSIQEFSDINNVKEILVSKTYRQFKSENKTTLFESLTSTPVILPPINSSLSKQLFQKSAPNLYSFNL